MLAQGLLLLCAVVYSQGFLFNPAPPPVRWVPVPIYNPAPKQIIKHVPIVKRVRTPVYIQREISVPQYIDRPYPVPIGGGVGGGIVGGVGGAFVGGASGRGISSFSDDDDNGSSIGSFGLNAQIEDADTVNIVAGVSGGSVGAGRSVGSAVIPVRRGYGYNDDNFGRAIGGIRRSSSSFGGIRRSFGPSSGIRRSYPSFGGIRRSIGGIRSSLGGYRRSLGGYRRSFGGVRRSFTRRFRGFNDDRFNDINNDDLFRRGFRDSRGILRGGRFNN